MNNKFLIIPVFLIGALIVGHIPDSFGHGLGSETMPPVMITIMDDLGDEPFVLEGTLEVNSSTIYTDIDGEEKGIRQISINFFETFTYVESNEVKPIDNVTFQVDLIKSGNVIISETFASFFGLASEQYNFEGEIFENGGLYEFEISVITINSYDNILTDPVNYELGISIEETTRYEINDVNYGKQELGIVTFFDQITEFDYNAETKEITFSFPFEWNQETIDQTTVIHEEVLVPKTFGDLLVAKYVGTLNEVDLPESMINIDDFSSDDRIVHVVVSQKELQEIFSNNEFSENKITMTVKPESDLPLSGVTENGQFKVNLWWTKELRSGEYTVIRYDILDTFLKDKPIAVPYELKIFHNGEKIFSKSNVSSDNKPDEGRPSNKNDFEWNIPLDVSGLIILKFENLDGGQVANVEFPLIVNREPSSQTSYQIPNWVKNNAGWWADGQIPDSAFIQGIEFLIKQQIVVVPIIENESTIESSVPEWIKTNAGWWADGQIDDKTFATGIEFLIKIGLIVV